ncbi:hypothetical protein PIB30_038716 [Stylosanthes scabra]|uniref:Uncharacterized protein n=1 Tax=Stylosanthes scabra TaxID=79078 RepID=A0ABU6RE77_9FABA|nr:hypothetical protein [Stylosanthes scabra]
MIFVLWSSETLRMSSLRFSVIRREKNTQLPQEECSSDLQETEEEVDLQGHFDAQLGLDAVRRLSDRIPNPSRFEDLAYKS